MMNQIARWGLAITCAFALASPLMTNRAEAGGRPRDTVHPAQVAARLTLTALCSPDPAAQRVWRVRNANPIAVEFRWDVYRSASGQAGAAVVPAASEIEPGEIIFTTATEAGSNTVRVFVGNVQQSVKASNPARCD